MKKLFIQKFYLRVFICLSFISVFCFENVKGQMVYLPDTNFRNELIFAGYGSEISGDSINSGSISVINAVFLDFQGSDIQDLQGIQAFHNLISLVCVTGVLSNIPALPPNLLYLDCYENQLTSLPPLPSSLIRLSCSTNLLTSIPPLPNSISSFTCDENQLTSLPALPNSLTDFSCVNNQLTSLPSLPSGLPTLSCWGNQLTSLPPLPSGLTELDCANNLLTSLPVLPSTLNMLHCPNNLITNLPALPDTLRSLYCNNNLLTSIPNLPDTLDYFDCSNNPSLTCLPKLNMVGYLYFTNTGITCLPNYSSYHFFQSDPPFSSVPLCGLFNPGGCSSFWNISGKVFFDANNDCVFNGTDTGQSNLHMLLYKNNNIVQQFFTVSEGFFSFYLNQSWGQYEVVLDTSNLPFDLLCPAGNSYNDNITTGDSLSYNNNFALKCKNGFDIGAKSIGSNSFLPAHNSEIFITAGDMSSFYGARCAAGISGSVIVTLNGPVSYLSPAVGALTPSNVSGNILTYNIPDFGTTDVFRSFDIIVSTDIAAPIGSQICVTVSVTPTISDIDTTNNALTHCFTVRASYDPNEKEVSPIGDVDVSGDKWLTYTIHFQNTGTAAAEHIYITDTLDQNLDLLTFQLLAYSHQPLVQILEGGIARFNFPNINLPDSNTNESASHGYVQYKIKLKNSVNGGIHIDNTAYIYFDFNSPVVTNTVVSNITNVLGITPTYFEKNEIKIFPNPTSGDFTLSFTSAGHFGEKASLKVYDLLGENVFEKEIVISSSMVINQTENILHKGVYVVEVVSKNFSERKKLVVE